MLMLQGGAQQLVFYKKPFEFVNLGILAYVGDERAITQVCVSVGVSAWVPSGLCCVPLQAMHPLRLRQICGRRFPASPSRPLADPGRAIPAQAVWAVCKSHLQERLHHEAGVDFHTSAQLEILMVQKGQLQESQSLHCC